MDGPSQTDPYQIRRLAMVEVQLRSRGIRDERVLAAMARLPRHSFVPPEHLEDAYGDFPLPIGDGQTISQPYVVAAMLEALALRPEDVVLEIGTGSGYQTALLAELTQDVYSIERHPRLAMRAEGVLTELGYGNIHLRVGDGTLGWPEAAPFDAIIVAAAAPQVPPSLFDQLREGARMIVPVGSAFSQELQLIRKQSGRTFVTHLDGCRFVPLIGREAFSAS